MTFFDAFTIDFADQLLPHQPRDSVQEFFCLFYSGRVDEAWAQLDDRPMADSWLRHHRDEEVARLMKKKNIPLLMLTGGGWFPSGNLGFVGDKPTAGLLFGMRRSGSCSPTTGLSSPGMETLAWREF